MQRSTVFVRGVLQSSRSSGILRSAGHIRPPARPSIHRFTPQSQHLFRGASAVRCNSSLTPLEAESDKSEEPAPRPSYALVFTCKPCGHRSAHSITKQAYHYGSVLITCPSCKARHIIADHLKIFMDQKSTLEDILSRNTSDGDISKLLKKGKITTLPGQEIPADQQDFEFWDDNKTDHEPLL